MQLFKTKPLVAGKAEGALVVSREPFSFFGGFDFASGRVADPRSDIFQENLSGKIFAYPGGKGSSSTAGVILEALRQGVAPKAIINVECEKILAVGVIVAQVFFNWSIPVISITAAEYAGLETGAYAEIHGSQLVVHKAS